MKYLTYFNILALTTTYSVAMATNSFNNQLQQAGALSQETNLLNQQENKLSKPSGQLFNNPIKIHSQNTNQSLKFELTSIDIKELGENGLENKISEDLTDIISPYLNREISLDDLNKLTNKITLYYRDNNYLVARAYLPPQEIENGHLTIGLIKGKIGLIKINNHSKLNENFIKRMANTSVNSIPYLAQDEVEKLSLLLNDIQGIESKLSIKAGKNLGETELDVELKDEKFWKAYLFTDNQGTEETGNYRLGTGIKLFNLAGIGDELNLDLLSSQNSNLKNIRLDYSGLLDGYGTRLGLTSSYLNYKLGKQFIDLNAKGNNKSIGIYLRHPTIRMPNLKINTQLTFNHSNTIDSQIVSQKIENQSKINKISIGINGVWNTVLQGTAYFNFIASIGREKNNTNEAFQNRPIGWKANNKFTLFNAEIGYEQPLLRSFALDLNLKSQLSDRNLSSNQKMLLGGLFGVRGYQAGIVSVTDGIIGQFTLKHYQPIFQNTLLTTSIYYDIGVGKKYHDIQSYSQRPEENNNTKLQSIGTELQFSSPNNYNISLNYSIPIHNYPDNNKKHQVVLSITKLF